MKLTNQTPNEEQGEYRAKTTDKMGKRNKLVYKVNKDLDEVADPLLNCDFDVKISSIND